MFASFRIFRVELISGSCMVILTKFFHFSFLCVLRSLKIFNISYFIHKLIPSSRTVC